MCSVVLPHVTDTSTPGTNARPSRSAAIAAGASPPTSSWSVSAYSSTPCSCARATTSAGGNMPSDMFE